MGSPTIFGTEIIVKQCCMMDVYRGVSCVLYVVCVVRGVASCHVCCVVRRCCVFVILSNVVV